MTRLSRTKSFSLNHWLRWRGACTLFLLAFTDWVRGGSFKETFAYCSVSQIRHRGFSSTVCHHGHWTTSVSLAANPWDSLTESIFPQKIDVPLQAEDIIEPLQDCMLTAVKDIYPRQEYDLPPGFRLGIYEPGDELAPLSPEALTEERMESGDRELAAAFVQLFAAGGNSGNLCVLFRSPRMCKEAAQRWQGTLGKVHLASFPGKKAVASELEPLGALRKAMKNRKYIVAVAPKSRQLKMLKELDDTEEKNMIFLLNARLRCLSKAAKTDVRSELAAVFNPVFHVGFVGPEGKALLYRSTGEPWVLTRRDAADPDTFGKEIWRCSSETDPTEEDLTSALAR